MSVFVKVLDSDGDNVLFDIVTENYPLFSRHERICLIEGYFYVLGQFSYMFETNEEIYPDNNPEEVQFIHHMHDLYDINFTTLPKVSMLFNVYCLLENAMKTFRRTNEEEIEFTISEEDEILI